MSNCDIKFLAVGWRSSTVWVILLSLLVLPLSVLLVTLVFSEPRQAATTVGYVLAEALLLYAGYGALARAYGPTAREILVRT